LKLPEMTHRNIKRKAMRFPPATEIGNIKAKDAKKK